MRRSLGKFSELEASNHTPSLADFTTTTSELRVFGTDWENVDAHRHWSMCRRHWGRGTIARKHRSGLRALWHRGPVDPSRVGSPISQQPGRRAQNGSPFRGLKSARFPKSDFKNLGALRPDDDRPSAAASHAGFGPGGQRGSTSALETVPVQKGATVGP
jgi:hypothetical protein